MGIRTYILHGAGTTLYVRCDVYFPSEQSTEGEMLLPIRRKSQCRCLIFASLFYYFSFFSCKCIDIIQLSHYCTIFVYKYWKWIIFFYCCCSLFAVVCCCWCEDFCFAAFRLVIVKRSGWHNKCAELDAIELCAVLWNGQEGKQTAQQLSFLSSGKQ